MLQILFSVRFEWQRMEQMPYNLLFRWFVGLGIDNPVWVPTVFTKNRDRLMTTEMSRKVMAAILAHREVAPLLSDDHLSVNGTLVKAWASMKNFQPKADDTPPDDEPRSPPGPDSPAKDQPQTTETDPMSRPTCRNRNAEVDFMGEKRTNATHASTTDPEARLYKKSPGTGAMLCFTGHALMDEAGSAIGPRNPPQGSGLIVRGDLTQAGGHAERRAALEMIHRHSSGSTRLLTLGADKGSTRPRSSPTCGKPASHPTSRRNRGIPRSTAAQPGMRVTPCRSNTANGSKKLSAGPKPSAGWPRPSIAASNGGVPASSSPWPPTTSPDCPACWPHDNQKPRQARMPSAPKDLKPNAAGCAKRKPFRVANFFSSLLGVSSPAARPPRPAP